MEDVWKRTKELTMKRKKKALNKEQHKKIKTMIQKELEKLIFNGIYCSDEFNLSTEDMSDEIDLANADVSNAQRLRFRNREVFYAKKLNDALNRMEKGSFGLCEECEEPIRYERLMARPTADLCITCKEEAERDESHSFLGRQSKSLGKRIDLVNHI